MPRKAATLGVGIAFLSVAAACGKSAAPRADRGDRTTLVIGYGVSTGQNPTAGVQRVARNIALDSLVTFGPDGRPRPGLVGEWFSSDESRELILRLRSSVKFQDGTPFDAQTASRILTETLPTELGPAFNDVESIDTVNERDVRVRFRAPSAFVLESLPNIDVQKPGIDALIGTGPYRVESSQANAVEMRRNDRYYQERPIIDRLMIKSFDSLRAAWAEMLRGQVDWLYEVDVDTLDSLGQSSKVRVVTFPQNYAYIIVLNTHQGILKNPQVRAALNASIDRPALVARALKGHGTPATTTLSPQHWAFDSQAPAFQFDPARAAAVLSKPKRQIAFSCVVLDGAPYDRIAIDVQRQLAAVGVAMHIVGMPPDKYLAAWDDATRFDAVLIRARIGGNLARPYQFWHSGVVLNHAGFKSGAVDDALDAIRHSTSEGEYRSAVSRFQRAIADDPPAIFLAWAEGARAVSTRFEVPIESGRDVLGTVRLWRPAADSQRPAQNRCC